MAKNVTHCDSANIGRCDGSNSRRRRGDEVHASSVSVSPTRTTQATSFAVRITRASSTTKSQGRRRASSLRLDRASESARPLGRAGVPFAPCPTNGDFMTTEKSARIPRFPSPNPLRSTGYLGLLAGGAVFYGLPWLLKNEFSLAVPTAWGLGDFAFVLCICTAIGAMVFARRFKH
jgi:hypothetical protein